MPISSAEHYGYTQVELSLAAGQSVEVTAGCKASTAQVCCYIGLYQKLVQSAALGLLLAERHAESLEY